MVDTTGRLAFLVEPREEQHVLDHRVEVPDLLRDDAQKPACLGRRGHETRVTRKELLQLGQNIGD